MSIPDTPTPARALRPSLLRVWREGEREHGTSSSDEDEHDILPPFPAFQHPSHASHASHAPYPTAASGASDDDVDAALRAPRKGKNVDPRERPRRRGPKKRPTRRIPSTLANRDPTRRFVSPTESVYNLTNQICSLGTDEMDEDEDALDEKDVTSTLLADVPEEGTSQLTPLPTSPAAGSDTEVDEPTSPLAAKTKARRAAARFARQARASAKKRKTRTDDSDDGAEALRALESLAEKIGYRLVPMSPGRGEPMDADPEFPLPPPMRVVPYTEGYVGCDDRDQKSKEPLPIVGRSATPETVEKIPHKATSPSTSRARQRYTTTVPLAKANEPVTPTQRRRRQRQRDVQHIPRSTGPETSHLKRTSPTSLLPSRVHLRKPRLFARRPVVLHRPRRVSRFLTSWGITDEFPPVVPGYVYAAAARDRAISRQVRSSLLRRHRERLALAHVSRRARTNSVSEEDAIEIQILLPSDDVEMFDSEMVDDELYASSPTSPSPIPGPSSRPHRPNKRAAAWGSAEVATRAEIRAAQRTKELGEWTHGLRMHILARRAAREAAKHAAAQRTREAVVAALHAVEEQRAEAAELARLAAEAQIAYDAEMARRASAAQQRARAQELAAQRRRRRAADSVAAHVAARPGTRLAAIHRRPAVPVPIATRNAPAGPSRPREREHTPEEQVEIQVEVEVSRAVREPQTPARPATPITLASPIQLADDSIPVPPSPPRYEYPFFPIVRAAPPVHLRAPVPRRVTAPAASPPHYVVNRYEIDDPPTPPPPYNAQTDCTTLVAAVFHADAEEVEVEVDERELAHEINVAAYAAMRRDREQERVLDIEDDGDDAAAAVDEEMDLEIENALGLQYAEYGAFAEYEDANYDADGRPAGALGALRRWLGW